jgi:hypothetical protein
MSLLMWHITFRRVLKASSLPILKAMAPAAGAGLAGALTGWGVQALLPAGTPVLVALVAVGGISTLVAVGLLVATDARVVGLLRRLRTRLRRRTDRPDHTTVPAEEAATTAAV